MIIWCSIDAECAVKTSDDVLMTIILLIVSSTSMPHVVEMMFKKLLLVE